MIELNAEQRQAVTQGEPVRIVDPLTHDAYVLVRAEVFARLSGELPRPVGQPNPEIPPLVLRSQQAFWHDLPELLKDKRNRGKWAAYHGGERVAVRVGEHQSRRARPPRRPWPPPPPHWARNHRPVPHAGTGATGAY